SSHSTHPALAAAPPLSLHDALPIFGPAPLTRLTDGKRPALAHTLHDFTATRNDALRSRAHETRLVCLCLAARIVAGRSRRGVALDRKSTRLNSSHEWTSYAVFCLKK